MEPNELLELQRLARLGAHYRMQELKAEMSRLAEVLKAPLATRKNGTTKTSGKPGRPRKKPHWSQTPKGRKRMSQITKKRWASGVYEGK